MQEIYVVTVWGRDAYECIVGLFSPQHVTREELLRRFPEDDYVIQEMAINRGLSDFE